MGGDTRKTWARIDQLMWDIRNKLRFLGRITPANVHAERERFLEHWRNDTAYNPSFAYDLSAFDAAAVEEMLTECDAALTSLSPAPHEFPIRTFYENTLDELWSAYKILTHLGDSATVQDHTTTIYGTPPTSDEVTTAEDILSTVPEQHSAGKQRSSDLHTACKELLETLELTDWGVTYTDAPYASASAAEKVIKVPNPLQDRSYRAGEPSMIAAHEVSHGIRAANGYNQLYNLFATGINGYYATDEGLSILLSFAYGENHPGILSAELRKYALRTIAADTAADGYTFQETFSTLMEYTQQEDLAWHVTLRAYRAGDGTDAGVIKDHIYLRGMTRVANRVLHSDDPEQTLRLLYIGKYGVSDLPTVEQLYHMDLLSDPKYTPFPLLETDTLLSMTEQIADNELGALLQQTA